ncbi:hypothetical protein [Paenibacillus selenitireducens]|uniref:hypothetical protein n=1 Tax=Paenibacillus selenitireducens TaxID=1324314 RepID=UPI001E573691
MVRGKSNLGLVVTVLLLGILMASMDNTIVSTAMGTIVSDLGGMDKFVWVTSTYMVAEMADVHLGTDPNCLRTQVHFLYDERSDEKLSRTSCRSLG